MIISPSKVNLLEKDVEDWLWANPNALAIHEYDPVIEWTHRQFSLPSGIADLVGMTEHGSVAVVEVKNTPIGPDALAQVARYASDIEWMCYLASIQANAPGKIPRVKRVVVGRSIDRKTFLEARALDITIFVFDVTLSLSLTEMDTHNTDLENFRSGQQNRDFYTEEGMKFLRSRLEQPTDNVDELLSFLDPEKPAEDDS